MDSKELLKSIDKERNFIKQLEQIRSDTQFLYIIQECNTKIEEHLNNINCFEKELREAHKYYSSSQLYDIEPVFYNAFQLSQYNCPDLDQKVQYMLEQLQYKIFTTRKEIDKQKELLQLYDNDHHNLDKKKMAEANIKEQEAFVNLLTKSIEGYKSKTVSTQSDNLDTLVQQKQNVETVENWELTITIIEAKNIVHADPVKRFRKRVESVLVFSVDGVETIRSTFSKSKVWNETIRLNVKRGRELQILMLDKPSKQYIPVAVSWINLFELQEEFNKKEQEQTHKSLTKSNSKNDTQIQFTLRFEPIGDLSFIMSLKKRIEYHHNWQ